MNSPLKWIGGKGHLKHKLLQYIPDHDYYLEPFFGAGSLFFAKKPVSGEIINDINSDVVNFFRMLQNKKKFKEFYRLINLVPLSRELYYEARDKYKKYKLGSVERCYYWFIKIRQSYSGNGNNWGFGKLTTASYILKNINTWLNCIEKLPEVVQRLKNTQIENHSFEKIFKIYDNPEYFIYCDPPYLIETRTSKQDYYKYEMSNKDHIKLLNCCMKAKNKIMISGYNSDMYNDYLKNWRKKEFKVCCNINVNKVGNRIEVIWMNYESEQPELFQDNLL